MSLIFLPSTTETTGDSFAISCTSSPGSETGVEGKTTATIDGGNAVSAFNTQL